MSDNASTQCEIVGPLGFLVQGILGVLAFFVLILKRHREKPKRQWKIWFMDTSKQMASMIVAHCLNVILALVLSSRQRSDACNWYFITLLLDTTLGMVISISLLRGIENVFEARGVLTLKSGNYVRVITPEEQIADDAIRKQHSDKGGEKMGTSLLRPIICIDYRIWGTQLAIWLAIVIFAKAILYGLQYLLSTPLIAFADFLLRSLDTHPDQKLILVMVMIPFFLNAFQFWIQDSVLKKNEFSQIEKQYAMGEIYEIELQEMIGDGGMANGSSVSTSAGYVNHGFVARDNGRGLSSNSNYARQQSPTGSETIDHEQDQL